MAASSRVQSFLQAAIKPSTFHVPLAYARDYLNVFVEAYPAIFVEHIEISDQPKLVAQAIHVKSTIKPTKKIPIVFIPSEKNSVDKQLPYLLSLLNYLQNLNPEVAVVIYIQDYYGNGLNHHDAKTTFTSVKLVEDIECQYQLFKYLEKQGYACEQLKIFAHSYGVNVSLLVLEKLIAESKAYEKVVFFSDRATGDPKKLVSAPARMFITDSNIALLQKEGYLSSDLLHNIHMVLRLPYALAVNTRSNGIVGAEATLVCGLQKEAQKMRGIYVDAEKTGEDSQYVRPNLLHLSCLKEVTVQQLQAAIILQKRLVVTFEGAKLEEGEFKDAIVIQSSFYTQLIKQVSETKNKDTAELHEILLKLNQPDGLANLNAFIDKSKFLRKELIPFAEELMQLDYVNQCALANRPALSAQPLFDVTGAQHLPALGSFPAVSRVGQDGEGLELKRTPSPNHEVNKKLGVNFGRG